MHLLKAAEIRHFLNSQLLLSQVAGEELSAYLTDEMLDRNKIYIHLPALFAEPFLPYIQPKEIFEWCMAGYLHFLTVVKVDDGFDNADKQMDNRSILLLLSLQQIIQSVLQEYFPPSSPFWKAWRDKHDTYHREITRKNGTHGQSVTSFRIYKKAAFCRNLLGLIALDCVRYRLDEESRNQAGEKLSQLEQVYNYFSLAYQMIDDIKDLKEDFRTGQLNFIPVRLSGQLGSDGIKQFDKVYKSFYLKGEYKKVYRQILGYLSRARKLALEAGATGWAKVLADFFRKVEMEYYDVDGFVRTVHTRGKLLQAKPKTIYPAGCHAPATGPMATLINPLLAELLSEKARNYGEMQHVMFLNKHTGFTGSHDIQVNDSFQRALMGDAWCDAMAVDRDFFRSMAQDELQYLIRKRQRDEIGGWSYYPDIPEIAADADDLGQVLQLMVRCGNKALAPEYASRAIEVLLNERTHASGGVETWIIPAQPQTPLQERQIEFNRLWGSGPDPEVTANFLYGLLLLNPQSYSPAILKGVEFLVGQVAFTGLWPSRWYYGDYYGTWTCIRLFTALEKQLSFDQSDWQNMARPILQQQGDDGGWGIQTGETDYLNSSLALLSLARIYPLAGGSAEIRTAVQKGAQLLLKSAQESDNQKFRAPFIRPRVKDPYCSATITRSYMLKAALAITEIINKNNQHGATKTTEDLAVHHLHPA